MTTNMDEAATQELVRRASRGEDGAVEQLMQKHRPRLKQMVAARMDPRIRARVDPSDVIQETFAVAVERLPQYLAEEPIPFYPWLRRIAWQKLVQMHEHHLEAGKRSVRRERRRDWRLSDQSTMRLELLLVSGGTSPSRAANRHEIRERVRTALDGLDEQDREVLLQRYLEQMTVKEIAAASGLSEATIHMRHLRALQKIKSDLEGDSP